MVDTKFTEPDYRHILDNAGFEKNESTDDYEYNLYIKACQAGYSASILQIDSYKKHLKAAWELLERQGWKPFGSHAAMENVPHLQFSDQVDEVGDPYFERIV